MGNNTISCGTLEALDQAFQSMLGKSTPQRDHM